MARLAGFVMGAALAWLSASAAAEPAPPPTFVQGAGEIFIADGALKRGDRLFAMPLRYSRTGILHGDLRVKALGNERVLLPSGSPVFRMPFYEDLGYTKESRGFGWCGVNAKPGKTGDGWCVTDTRIGYGSSGAARMGGSPYLPGRVSPVALWGGDPRPTIEEKYVDIGMKLERVVTFDGWVKGGARIADGVYDARGAHTVLTLTTLPLEQDGSALFSVEMGALRLRPGADKKSATVETAVVFPPFALIAPPPAP